jgi:hypothetical protein
MTVASSIAVASDTTSSSGTSRALSGSVNDTPAIGKEADSRGVIFLVLMPFRYSINITLDGCCDHNAGLADEDLHHHAIENLNRADALLFGRVTYEMMEAAFRPAAEAVERA